MPIFCQHKKINLFYGFDPLYDVSKLSISVTSSCTWVAFNALRYVSARTRTISYAETPRSQIQILTPNDVHYNETQIWRNHREIYNLSWYINAPKQIFILRFNEHTYIHERHTNCEPALVHMHRYSTERE